MSVIVQAIKRFDDLMFQRVPADTCALLRLVVAVIGGISVAAMVPVAMHWDLSGIVPSVGGGTGLRSIVRDSGLAHLAAWVLYGTLICGFLLLAIGYRSRMMNAICLLGAIAQARWNPLPLSMAWQVEVCLLFCLFFANSGGSFSVDAKMARHRGRPAGTVTPMWPLYLMRYQIALIYFSSGLWKLVGTSWRDGSALHYVLNNHVYQRVPYLASPTLDLAVTAGTYITLCWELAFPVLILSAVTRRVALLMGVVIHLGIWATMEVGAFSWIMLASYIAFLDPVRTAQVLRRPLREWPGALLPRAGAAISAT